MVLIDGTIRTTQGEVYIIENSCSTLNMYKCHHICTFNELLSHGETHGKQIQHLSTTYIGQSDQQKGNYI